MFGINYLTKRQSVVMLVELEIVLASHEKAEVHHLIKCKPTKLDALGNYSCRRVWVVLVKKRHVLVQSRVGIVLPVPVIVLHPLH